MVERDTGLWTQERPASGFVMPITPLNFLPALQSCNRPPGLWSQRSMTWQTGRLHMKSHSELTALCVSEKLMGRIFFCCSSSQNVCPEPFRVGLKLCVSVQSFSNVVDQLASQPACLPFLFSVLLTFGPLADWYFCTVQYR